jgi:hypothetical protein
MKICRCLKVLVVTAIDKFCKNIHQVRDNFNSGDNVSIKSLTGQILK